MLTAANSPSSHLPDRPDQILFRNIIDLERGRCLTPAEHSQINSSLTPKSSSSTRSSKFSSIMQLFAGRSSGLTQKQPTEMLEVHSLPYRVFKSYQKQVSLIIEEPLSSIPGKIMLISILLCIFINLSEAILACLRVMNDNNTTFKCLSIFMLIVFSLDFILRLSIATTLEHKIVKAVLQPLFVIDLIVVIPLFIEVFFRYDDAFLYLRSAKLISLSKAFTILKVMRYVKNGHILMKGIKQCLTSLGFLLVLFIMACFVFATMAYYAEISDPKSSFNKGIPSALWWTIVTMTTVGYGDMVPLTPIGKVIGSIVSIYGLVFLAFPVAILGYHFQELYNEMEEQQRIVKLKGNLQKTQALNESQKEAYFLKMRTTHLETSNRRVSILLDDLNKTQKSVSKDLRGLYHAVYKEASIALARRGNLVGRGSSGMSKFLQSAQKLKVLQVFNGGLLRKLNTHNNSSSDEKSSDGDKPKDCHVVESSQIHKKMKSIQRNSFFIDLRPSFSTSNVEDIIFETDEYVSTMSNITPKVNPMAISFSTNPSANSSPKYQFQSPKRIEQASSVHLPIHSAYSLKVNNKIVARSLPQKSDIEELETEMNQLPFEVSDNYTSMKDNTVQSLIDSYKTLPLKGLTIFEEPKPTIYEVYSDKELDGSDGQMEDGNTEYENMKITQPSLGEPYLKIEESATSTKEVSSKAWSQIQRNSPYVEDIDKSVGKLQFLSVEPPVKNRWEESID